MTDIDRPSEQSVGDLLAVIHGDGGHYIEQHGWEKALRDGVDVVVGLRQALEEWAWADYPVWLLQKGDLVDYITPAAGCVRRVVVRTELELNGHWTVWISNESSDAEGVPSAPNWIMDCCRL